LSARYHLWVSGCQMNDSDARRLADALDDAGLLAVEGFDDADAVILYTCSVRQNAENRVHGQLGHLKGLKRRRPHMLLCVTGCMAGADKEELRRRYPHVDLFVSPMETEDLACQLLAAAKSEDHCAPAPSPRSHEVPVSVGITAITGCDKYCSYCIVPYRRGPQRSRPAREILAEAADLVARGAREVVLLGQTVDSWGRDLQPQETLASLLRDLDTIPNLSRLRFLTSHPNDFTDDLIDAIVTIPALCEELNLPIQAGDDEILRRMARPYSSRQYLELVDRIRRSVPDIALSTDVIVGFPGEKAEQFDRTVEILRAVEFDIVHVAAYSPRPGTAAARKMVDDVPAEEKKRRLHVVEGLQREIATVKNEALVGKTVEVLIETRAKGKWSGRTRSNKLVFVESDQDLRGQLVQVAVDGAGPWSLRGSLTLPS